MSVWAILIASICYLVTAIANFRQKDYPHCMMWFSYFLANCGLIWYEVVKDN